MGEPAFFLPSARASVVAAIRAIELQTSAEIVVAVRRTAGSYRQTDISLGAAVAFVALLSLLFHPMDFAVESMPLDVALAFALGFAASGSIGGVRRALTSRARMEANVRTAAHAAFYELGISHTKRRGGILVYVAIFERRVEVAVDTGVDVAALGEPWKEALLELQAAVRQTSFTRFGAALAALGPILARALPVTADDTNELPDEVA